MKMKMFVILALIVCGLSGSICSARAQNSASNQMQPVYIKNIVISGFVLRDKTAIQRIIKANQNKRLNQDDIDKIVNDIKTLYLQEGYTGLVDVHYKIEKKKLLIDVLLLQR